jgi:hypothetical protein
MERRKADGRVPEAVMAGSLWIPGIEQEYIGRDHVAMAIAVAMVLLILFLTSTLFRAAFDFAGAGGFHRGEYGHNWFFMHIFL